MAIAHWDLDSEVSAPGGNHRLPPDETLTLAPVDVKAALLTPSEPLSAALLQAFPREMLMGTPTLPWGAGGLHHPAAVRAAVLTASRSIHDLLTRAARKAFSDAPKKKVLATWISTAGTVSRFSIHEALALQARLHREHQPHLRKYFTLALNDAYVTDKPSNTLRARAVTLTALLELGGALRGDRRLDDLITKGIAPQQLVLPDLVLCLEAPRSMPWERFVGLCAALAVDMGQPFFEEAANFLLNGRGVVERQQLSMIVPGRAHVVWAPAPAAELLQQAYAYALATPPQLDSNRVAEAANEVVSRLRQRFGRSPLEWLCSSGGPRVLAAAAEAFNGACGEARRNSVPGSPRRVLGAVDKAMEDAANDLVAPLVQRVEAVVRRALGAECDRLTELAKGGDLAGISGAVDAALRFLTRFEKDCADAQETLEDELGALFAERDELHDEIAPPTGRGVSSASPAGVVAGFFGKWILRAPVTQQAATPSDGLGALNDYVQLWAQCIEAHAQVEALHELAALLQGARAPFEDERRRVERLLQASAEAASTRAALFAETEARLVAAEPAAPGIFLPGDEEVSAALLQHFAPEAALHGDRVAVLQEVYPGWAADDDALAERIAAACLNQAQSRFGRVGTLGMDALLELLPDNVVRGIGGRLAVQATPCADLNEARLTGGEHRFLACPGGANSSTARRLLATQTLKEPLVMVSPYATPECEAAVYLTFTDGVGVDALARTLERLEAVKQCDPDVLWADCRFRRDPYRSGADWDELIVRAMAAKAISFTGWRKPAPRSTAFYIAVPEELWPAFEPRQDHPRCGAKATSVEKLRALLGTTPDLAANLEARVDAYEIAKGSGALREAGEALLAGGNRWYPANLQAAAQAWLDRERRR